MANVNVLPPMARPTIGPIDARMHVTIASIWFKPFQSEEPHYQMLVDDETGDTKIAGCTFYRIEGAGESIKDAASTVQLLKVYDSFHVHLVPTTIPGQRARSESLPLGCKAIADSLVEKWTNEPGGAARGNSMGMMVIAGDEPTTAEIQQMIKAQSAYCQGRINEAQQAWNQGHVSRIGEIERLSAKWMSAHTKMPWYQATDARDMKECLACGGSMPEKAIRCVNCGDLLDMALKGYWSEPQLQEADPFLFERYKDVKVREADRERKRAKRAKANGEPDSDEE